MLLIGGIVGIIIWVKKNNSPPSPSSNNPPDDPNDNPPNDNPPPSENPPSDNKNNNDQDNDKNDKDKKEIKVFWNANPKVLIEGYDDYWLFASDAKNVDRFLISYKHPVLVNKNLKGSEFTLAYSENEIVKKVLKTGEGGAQLILLESGFTLTPDTPLKDDPEFLDRSTTGKSIDVYFDYSQYTGGDFVFIDNQIQEGREEKDLDKFVLKSDNPSIQELLAKNHLQNQPKRSDKEFEIRYLEKDIEKYDSATHTYYLNNQAKVKTATFR